MGHDILVISPDPEYGDEVSQALTEIGAVGVLVPDAGAAAEALASGVQPELVLLDPLFASGSIGECVVMLLRATPQLATIPVVILGAPPPPGAAGTGAVRVVDREVLATAVRRFEDENDLWEQA